MSKIEVGFGSLEPVMFKEKGLDQEFAARVYGTFYIDDYPEEEFGHRFYGKSNDGYGHGNCENPGK